MIEQELLGYLVKLQHGIDVPVYGIEVEAELCRLYMPRPSPTASNVEIALWGNEFKRIISLKIAAREAEMLEAGELA